jgi:ABC-type dipeptide/oligopeptide/nickel transport system permease component
MLVYTLRRILLFIPVLFTILFITFTLGFFAPGDPLEIHFDEEYTTDPAVLARLRHLYGLDRPFWVQFGDYIWKIGHGDMGQSLRPPRQQIWDRVKQTFPISMQLGLASGFLVVVFGIALGALAAVRQNTWVDYMIVTGSIAANSIHVIVLAPALMVIFVVVLDVMKTPTGWNGLFSTTAMIPVFILTSTTILGVVRLTRSAVLEVINQNYVRTARAKGMKEPRVITRHMMKNALTPVLTSMGLTLSGLITGAFFIERIFAIPGFAGMGIDAFQARDYPVILATTMVSATIIIVANLLVDLGYGLLDPRVRY